MTARPGSTGPAGPTPGPSSAGPPAVVRPLAPGDLAVVVALQRRAYAPRYHEGQAVYARRRARFPTGCLGAFEGDVLVAYAIGFPWPARRAVALHAGPMDGAAERPSTLYVHDVATAPTHRGRGVAAALVSALAELPDCRHLPTASLVAVQGAAGHWRRLGFEARPEVGLGSGYADGDVFMEVDLADLRAHLTRGPQVSGRPA